MRSLPRRELGRPERVPQDSPPGCQESTEAAKFAVAVKPSPMRPLRVYGGHHTTAVASSKTMLSTDASHRSHRRRADLQPTATHTRPTGARNPLKLQLGNRIRAPTAPTSAPSPAHGRGGDAASRSATDICSTV